jgi:predicted alpha/beta-hydrolase family hydrolase
MVKWSPEERVEALDALKHPFILNGLPKQVKQEHLKQVNSDNPYNLF